MPINRVTKIDLPAGMSFTQATDAELWTFDAQCGSQTYTSIFLFYFEREIACVNFVVCSQTNIYILGLIGVFISYTHIYHVGGVMN